MKKNVYGLNVCVCLALALTTGGCIDHDYDLSEDIDLTVKVGGESFTIPKSSTDVIKLTQIFDLGEGSSIKTVSQGEYGLSAGDYVLVQSGDPTSSNFHIGDVTIGDPSNNVAMTDEILFAYVGNREVTSTVKPTLGAINLNDDNVTEDLVSVSGIGLDMTLKLNVAFVSSTNFSGTVYINEGYKVTFPESWYLEIQSGTPSQVSLADHNVLVFKERVGITTSKPLDILIGVSKIDLSSLPAGQGLYKRGHFRLNSDITSEGKLTIDSWSNVPVGTVEKLQLITTTDLVSATITSMTGVIDPKITIDDTRFSINDIPDFLADENNSLDISNPEFYVTVTNNSPVPLELNAQLASYKNGVSTPFATAKIGAEYGTTPVRIAANGTSKILISQKPVSTTDATNVVVSNLSDLIKTIPDYMVFGDVECRVVQEEVTLYLAPTYHFNTDYEAVIPLSFGESMNLHYTDDETDWDAEDDLKKVEFHKALVSFTAINSIPLSMVPEVKALDHNGNVIDDVTATVEGSIKAGTIAAPTTNPIKVVLQSNSKSLSRLDGVRLIFDATSDPSHTGDNLNEAQSLRFTDITVEIIGGVTIDLN